MPEDYGRHRLAGLALAQIEQAENDPRAASTVGLRDAFYAATGEAENLRSLAELGLLKISAQPVDQQAKWAQSYVAKLMIEGDHAYLNGMTLVAIYSAVDAMIESMVPSRVEAIVALQALAALHDFGVDLDDPNLHDALDAAIVSDQATEALAKIVKKTGRVGSSGLSRYERHLRAAQLTSFPDREFPEDLDLALKEIGALRDVLVHSGAKVDKRALAKAPTLPERGYPEGSFVRIGRADYRTYSAALYTFAEEVLDRMMLQIGQHRPNRLEHWRENATLNA